VSSVRARLWSTSRTSRRPTANGACGRAACAVLVGARAGWVATEPAADDRWGVREDRVLELSASASTAPATAAPATASPSARARRGPLLARLTPEIIQPSKRRHKPL
jgi:hypothetical protein